MRCCGLLPAQGLTLVEVIAATVLLAMVAITVTPALRRSGPHDADHAAAETWLRARLAAGAGQEASAPESLQWRRTPVPRRGGMGEVLPGTATAWTLIEVIDVRGRVLVWRVVPQDGPVP